MDVEELLLDLFPLTCFRPPHTELCELKSSRTRNGSGNWGSGDSSCGSKYLRLERDKCY